VGCSGFCCGKSPEGRIRAKRNQPGRYACGNISADRGPGSCPRCADRGADIGTDKRPDAPVSRY